MDSGVDLSRRMVSDLPAAAAVAAAAAVISGGRGTQVAALEDRALQVKCSSAQLLLGPVRVGLS